MSEEKQKTDEVSPESLMDHFHGPGLSKMLMVTLSIHLLVLLGTSVPFLIKSVTGGAAELSKEERVDQAVADATASLQDIAEKHGLNPQEISDRFSSGAPRKSAAPGPAKVETPKPAPEPIEPTSPIEKEIQKAAPGPKAPVFEDEEDLFK